MGRMYLPECDERKLQCPICERVFPSEKKIPQCSGCRYRFEGDDFPYKTLEDRKGERKAHEKQLMQVQTELKSLISIVELIRKDLKPLN